MSIHLKPNYLDMVVKILKKYVPDCKVWAFGSRTTDHFHPYSDLDLLIQDKDRLNLAIFTHLSEDFAESDLPIKVDIIDWHRITKEFRDHIRKHCERLY